MKKRFRTIITILLMLAFALIIGYPKLKHLLKSENNPPAGGKGNPGSMSARQKLSVSGFLIKPAQMSVFQNSTGTLKPDEEVELSFETSGKIVGINFKEGTKVKKGDLLAKMNDKPLQAQLQKLLAQKKLVEEKEFRQRSLLDRDAISKESYDQIVTELQSLEADINLINARISETELRAPFDGIIGLRYLSEGSYATPSTKIARLVKLSPIKVEFSIPERYADEVQKGFPITFKIDGNTNIYNAEVYAVDPKIEIETRVIVLRAIYPNTKEELKPGRYASVTLKLSQIDNAISVPTEAIIPEMEGEFVFTYKSGKASRKKVTTGLRTESMIQVTNGLKFGDTLLTTGILQLRQNIPVALDTLVII